MTTFQGNIASDHDIIDRLKWNTHYFKALLYNKRVIVQIFQNLVYSRILFFCTSKLVQ